MKNKATAIVQTSRKAVSNKVICSECIKTFPQLFVIDCFDGDAPCDYCNRRLKGYTTPYNVTKK